MDLGDAVDGGRLEEGLIWSVIPGGCGPENSLCDCKAGQRQPTLAVMWVLTMVEGANTLHLFIRAVSRTL